MGPSGVVSVPGVQFEMVWTGEDLRTELVGIVAKQIEALAFDRVEVENAKANAKGRWCKEGDIYQWGYDEKKSNQAFRELETGIIQTLERLAGADLIREHDTIGNLPGLGDGEGIVKQWMATGDAVVPNMHRAYVEWNAVTSDLDQMSGDARSLMTDSWQSAAGDAYRATAQQRIREIDALRSLAQNSRDSVHSLSYIQSAITAVIGKYLTTAKDECEGKDGHPVIPKTYTDFDKLSRAQLRDFHVYSVSLQVSAHVAAAVEQIVSVEASYQEWLAVSRDVGDQLDRAAQATRDAHTHDSTVRTTTVDETEADPHPSQGDTLKW